MTKFAKKQHSKYFQQFKNVPPGTKVKLEKKGDEPFHVRYSRAGYVRKALTNDGFTCGVTSDYTAEAVYIHVIVNPHYKAPELTNPQVKEPPRGIGRIEFHRRTIDEDAADFFRDAVLAVLPMEDAPKAFEKAKQATELFRRHLGEQLKPLNA